MAMKIQKNVTGSFTKPQVKIIRNENEEVMYLKRLIVNVNLNDI